MPILGGFLTIFAFYLLGESVRILFDVPVSGGVLGMLALAFWLMVRGTPGQPLASASQALISILVLLIMPGIVGVFFTADQFSGYWLAIGGALVLGTLLSVVTTLLLMRAVAGHKEQSCVGPESGHD